MTDEPCGAAILGVTQKLPLLPLWGTQDCWVLKKLSTTDALESQWGMKWSKTPRRQSPPAMCEWWNGVRNEENNQVMLGRKGNDEAAPHKYRKRDFSSISCTGNVLGAPVMPKGISVPQRLTFVEAQRKSVMITGTAWKTLHPSRPVSMIRHFTLITFCTWEMHQIYAWFTHAFSSFFSTTWWLLWAWIGVLSPLSTGFSDVTG